MTTPNDLELALDNIVQRLIALESSSKADAALWHEHEERIAALEARPVSLPPRNPVGAEQRAVVVTTRLAEIESELAALALRRGALVGERERLR